MALHPELAPLATPSAPAVVVKGTVGSTHYGYKVVATNARGHSIASSETTVTTGNPSLNAMRYQLITPPVVSGATGFDIYRTTGGSSQGKIGSVRGRTAFKDTGLAGDDSEAPAHNTSGLWLYYTAWNTDDNAGQAEDLNNHTISLSADGAAAVEMDNNGVSGSHVEIANGEYAILCSATEANANTLDLCGLSETSNVVIVPTRVKL